MADKNKKWKSIIIDTPSDREILFSQIWSFHPEGLEEVENSNLLNVFFKNGERASEFEKFLKGRNFSFKVEEIENKDWTTNFRKSFTSFLLNKKVRISPPWDKKKEPGRMEILIYPGMAFGTGQHETTKLVLNSLSRNLKGRKSFLDIGCGSGILTLYCRKAGLKECLGFDNDPDAIENARINLKLNRFRKGISFLLSEITEISGYYDLMACNIISSKILELQDNITSLMTKESIVVFSGILVKEGQFVKEKLSKNFFLHSEVSMGEWVAFTAGKKF